LVIPDVPEAPLEAPDAPEEKPDVPDRPDVPVEPSVLDVPLVVPVVPATPVPPAAPERPVPVEPVVPGVSRVVVPVLPSPVFVDRGLRGSLESRLAIATSFLCQLFLRAYTPDQYRGPRWANIWKYLSARGVPDCRALPGCGFLAELEKGNKQGADAVEGAGTRLLPGAKNPREITSGMSANAGDYGQVLG
jgi:hypothetical protein